MKQESDILSKLGKDAGFKVPENYFADFNKKLMESLPEPNIKKAYDIISEKIKGNRFLSLTSHLNSSPRSG